MTEDEQEEFYERIAICFYDGECSRNLARSIALEQIRVKPDSRKE